MYTLKIDLQDGFKNDNIVIELNGQEIYKKENMSTQLLLGYADTFSLKLLEGEVEVEIRLPLVDLEKTVSLNIDHDTYLGISVIAGDIEYIVSNEPFYYQ